MKDLYRAQCRFECIWNCHICWWIPCCLSSWLASSSRISTIYGAWPFLCVGSTYSSMKTNKVSSSPKHLCIGEAFSILYIVPSSMVNFSANLLIYLLPHCHLEAVHHPLNITLLVSSIIWRWGYQLCWQPHSRCWDG